MAQGEITVRLGTVERDGQGAEVIIWDGGFVCAACGAPYDDLSRLWDGVALWVALDTITQERGWGAERAASERPSGIEPG